MSTLAVWIVGTALLWAIVFAGFVWLVRARWLARFTSGFLLELIIGLVGVGMMSASIVGVWGYMVAWQILDDALVVEMRDVGLIVEREINAEVGAAQMQLQPLPASLADARDLGASPAEIASLLDSAKSFDAHYLQLRLVDAKGTILAETSGAEPGESMSPIALGFNQEGKPFTSEAYSSPVFKRQVSADQRAHSRRVEPPCAS